MRYEHIPDRIIKHGKEIWDAHEYTEYILWRNSRIREHIQKLILKLPYSPDSRINSVETMMQWKYQLKVGQSQKTSHLMDIQFIYYENEPLIAGMMPVINVCFSHVFDGFNDYYSGCETELRDGKTFFRARRVDEPEAHIIGESENWGVRANGRLIWCENSLNSIDQAGWCFSLPMAAVETPDDAEECIIDPLKILMQGINPDEVEIPFSPNTLRFMVRHGVWELAG